MTHPARIRRLFLGVAALGLTFVLAIGGGTAWLWATADVSTVGTTEFTRPLTIPPLADSIVDSDGTRVFTLDMQAGTTEFETGRETDTWGFNGAYLGPTLRAANGERVRVQVRNNLPEASSVHWHGMHLPATMDGGPHQMVEAGATWTPEWTVAQPASTLWYHPHPHGATEDHVRRGLAGMFWIDDDLAGSLPLPNIYGVNDVPLIVQDLRLRGQQLDGTRTIMGDVGFLGENTMVNGTIGPYQEVGDELVRLRLLNAATARTFTFAFDDTRPFALIGTDGGLLERPAALDRVRLSPGERAEIVVRMRPGERTILRGERLDAGLDFWGNRFAGGDDTFDILELRAEDVLRPSPELPTTLVTPSTPDGSDAVTERHFDLTFAKINDAEMAMDRIDFTVTRGTTEKWVVHNADGMPHNFHVHDVQFRVLDFAGAPPPPDLADPKDTIFLAPGTTATLAMRFDGPADPTTPYMFHCHLLWHEDRGMMGQFVVVEPGQQAATPPRHAH
ncbi:multicopper oxidase family protein [Nocardia mangyaensis]|uniref:multicopper oxidase family protein n=1 Tax=Nocardia mangyaensis TaxID=2213200 RepID=UPI002675F5DB|nr:multicopper oxidase domain-containing protein [Nocardia mangyaensis]MDO3649289.1 multicopper oxidase domain-containing protein [Nocardia mangyaensis]